ncbi:hypothetical protein DRJ25_02285, partial [Candidatus Woesearchaeota archaeon]
ENFEFAVFSIGGLSIQEFIDTIPDIKHKDMLALNGDVIACLNNISNNDTTFNIVTNGTELSLSNLLDIDKFYDKHGINNELADWICGSIFVLQYMYDVYSDGGIGAPDDSDDLESLKRSIIEYKKAFHDDDEFNIDLAMSIHELERRVTNIINSNAYKFKCIVELLSDDSRTFICTFGIGVAYNIKGITKAGIKSVVLLTHCGDEYLTVTEDGDVDEFLNDLIDIATIDKIWENES